MPRRNDGAENARRIGYVLTHYPKLSQTFIAGEIAELRTHGIDVVPFALNAPDSSDLRTPRAQQEQRRTFYVKGSGVAAMVRRSLAAPISVSNCPT